MKTLELFSTVIKTPQNENYVDIEALCEEVGGIDYFDLNVPPRDELLLTSYWFFSWICTDTEVGCALYFFQGEPAFFTEQPARKSDTSYTWVSKDMYRKVEAYLQSLSVDNIEDNIDILVDEDEELFFILEYAGQALPQYTPHLSGVPTKILKQPSKFKGAYNFHMVNIEDGSEEGAWVDIRDLKFKAMVEV